MLKKLILAAVLVFLAEQSGGAYPWCSSVHGQECAPWTQTNCINDSDGYLETCDCMRGRWICTF